LDIGHSLQGNLPEDEEHRIFQFATYATAADTLAVRVLNADVVKRDAKSTDELTQAIAAAKDSPDLFREPMSFTRVRQTTVKTQP
jgi:hypothetical protein